MKVLYCVSVVVAACVALGAAGCGGSDSDEIPAAPAEQLLRQLALQGPERGLAAHDLTRLSAGELRKVLPKLKELAAAEKEKGIKTELQKAIAKADGG